MPQKQFQFPQPPTLDLSIVTVSFNTRPILLDCLESVLAHTCDIGFEIVVVDNHSSDGSAEAVRERFPGITVIHNRENRGFSAANNQAIRASRGRLIVLLNSDTLLRENSFLKICDYMNAHPEFSILGPLGEHGQQDTDAHGGQDRRRFARPLLQKLGPISRQPVHRRRRHQEHARDRRSQDHREPNRQEPHQEPCGPGQTADQDSVPFDIRHIFGEIPAKVCKNLTKFRRVELGLLLDARRLKTSVNQDRLRRPSILKRLPVRYRRLRRQNRQRHRREDERPAHADPEPKKDQSDRAG